MWLFPLHSAQFFVWETFFRNTFRRHWKDRGWTERTPGEPQMISKQIKKAKGGFYCETDSWALQSGRWCYNLMAWDWTKETLKTHMWVCRCARMCGGRTHTDTHTHNSILPFQSIADTLEKRQLQRKGWVVSVILNQCVCVCVCVCVYVCAQCVAAYLDPDPLPRTPSHLPSHLCLLQGHTAGCHRAVSCWLLSIRERAWRRKGEQDGCQFATCWDENTPFSLLNCYVWFVLCRTTLIFKRLWVIKDM